MQRQKPPINSIIRNSSSCSKKITIKQIFYFDFLKLVGQNLIQGDRMNGKSFLDYGLPLELSQILPTVINFWLRDSLYRYTRNAQ